MRYETWLNAHIAKHRQIVKKLSCMNRDEIIRYFRFENLLRNEPTFCPLFKTNTKCHKIDELNCYLCACPYFRFNDEGLYQKGNKTVYSFCAIDAKEAVYHETEESLHLDCSACALPHKESFIKKHFSRSLAEVLKESFTPCENQ